MINSAPIYQLVKTKALDPTSGQTLYDDVYSILALYPSGDCFESEFIYDVTRISERAEQLLALIKENAPTKGTATDFISDNL